MEKQGGATRNPSSAREAEIKFLPTSPRSSTTKKLSSGKQPKSLSLRCSSSVIDIGLTTQHSLAGTQQCTDYLFPVYVILGLYTGRIEIIYFFGTASTPQNESSNGQCAAHTASISAVQNPKILSVLAIIAQITLVLRVRVPAVLYPRY